MTRKTGWKSGWWAGLAVFALFSLLWVTAVLFMWPAYAAEDESARTLLPKKAVVLLVNGLQLEDLSPETTPNLWRMAQQGAAGVMNHNALGPRNETNSYLTIGAGTKAAAPFSRVQAYETGENVLTEAFPVTGEALYRRHMGRSPKGEIVVPQIPQMEAHKEAYRYSFTPGLLGQAVQDLGGRTAVLGNSDLGHIVHRPAALLAMNRQGIADLGDLQAGLVPDAASPFGMRTDGELLYAAYEKVRSQASLIVIETGDLLRLFHEREVMTEEQEARAYRQALAEADRLAGRLMRDAGADTLVAVVSPIKHPDPEAPALTPVLLAGGDVQPGSLLTSGTTKREGLIANYDLAPTLVEFLGGKSDAYPFVGRPAEVDTAVMQPAKMQPAETQPKQDSLTKLKDIVHDILIPSESRKLLVTPWVDAWIGLAALILIAQLFRRAWLRYLQPIAEFMLTFPLVWLLVPLFDPQTVSVSVLLSITLTALIWLGLRFIRAPRPRIGLLAGATALLLMADVLAGAPLLKKSMLSYDPIVGARYYGIGNEYMGILLGAVLLSFNVWLSARKRPLSLPGQLTVVGLCAFTLCLFAAPELGTNAGGALAGAVGFTYAAFHLLHLRLTRRVWLWFGLAAGGAVAAMALLNFGQTNGEQTHIGRFMALLLSGQFADVYQIISRKFMLNFHLLRVSAWGKLFVLFLGVLAVWQVRRWMADRSLDTNPFAKRNGNMVLVMALAAFLFNDSGVVAASLAMLYAVVPLLEPEKGAAATAVEMEEIPPPSQ